MTVVTDGHNYEKIILFGGIQNNVKSPEELANQKAVNSVDSDENEVHISPSSVKSFLTNQTYLINVK